MKKPMNIIAFVVLTLGVILTSYGSSVDKVQDSKQNVKEVQRDLDRATQDYAIKYNKFKLKSEIKIKANEKSIADLKTYSKLKKKEVKKDYEKSISELEAKNEKMKAKISDYKEEGNEKWNSFKVEFNHDMDELGKSIKDLGKNNVK